MADQDIRFRLIVNDDGSAIIRRVEGEFDRLGQSARRSGREVRDWRGEMDRARHQAGGVATAIRSANTQAQLLATTMQALRGSAIAAAVAFATLGLKKVVQEMVQVAASFEAMQIKLDALTMGRGKQVFDELNAWAIKMPVNTEQAINSFVTLKAMGLDPTIKTMTILTDVSSVLGSDVMPRLALVLGQMSTLGKINAQDLNQFAQAGVNARKYIMEAFNMSIEDVQKAGVNMENVIQVILDGMEKDFGGSASKMMGSWQGVTDTFYSWWKEATRRIMESGPFDWMKEQVTMINDMLASMMGDDSWQVAQAQLEKLLELRSRQQEVKSRGNAGGLTRIGAVGLGAPKTLERGSAESYFEAIEKAADETSRSIAKLYEETPRLAIERIKFITEEMKRLSKEASSSIYANLSTDQTQQTDTQKKIASYKAEIEEYKNFLDEEHIETQKSIKREQTEDEKAKAKTEQGVRDLMTKKTEAHENWLKSALKLYDGLEGYEQQYLAVVEEVSQRAGDVRLKQGFKPEEVQAYVTEMRNAMVEQSQFAKQAKEEVKALLEKKKDEQKAIEKTAEAEKKAYKDFLALIKEKQQAYDTYLKTALDVYKDLPGYEKEYAEAIEMSADQMRENLVDILGPGSAEAVDKFIEKWKEGQTEIEDGLLEISAFAQDTMRTMSDFMYDSMTGQMKGIEDYWQGMWQAMARTASNAMANQAFKELKGMWADGEYKGGYKGLAAMGASAVAGMALRNESSATQQGMQGAIAGGSMAGAWGAVAGGVLGFATGSMQEREREKAAERQRLEALSNAWRNINEAIDDFLKTGLNDVAQAFAGLENQFDGYRGTLISLGANVAQLIAVEEQRAASMEKLRKELAEKFARPLEEMIAGLTLGPDEAKRVELDNWYDEQIDKAKLLGSESVALLEKTYMLSLSNYQETLKTIASATQQYQDIIRQSTLSEPGYQMYQAMQGDENAPWRGLVGQHEEITGQIATAEGLMGSLSGQQDAWVKQFATLYWENMRGGNVLGEPGAYDMRGILEADNARRDDLLASDRLYSAVGADRVIELVNSLSGIQDDREFFVELYKQIASTNLEDINAIVAQDVIPVPGFEDHVGYQEHLAEIQEVYDFLTSQQTMQSQEGLQEGTLYEMLTAIIPGIVQQNQAFLSEAINASGETFENPQAYADYLAQQLGIGPGDDTGSVANLADQALQAQLDAISQQFTSNLQGIIDQETMSEFDLAKQQLDVWYTDQLQAAEELGLATDLVTQAYDLQLESLNEQYEAVEDLTEANNKLTEANNKLIDSYQDWTSTFESIQSQILGMKTGAGSPFTGQEQLAFVQQEISSVTGGQGIFDYLNSLQSESAQMSGIDRLQSLFGDYLTVAQDVYQKPSSEYRGVFDDTLGSLEDLADFSQNMMSDYGVQLEQRDLLSEIVYNTSYLSNMEQHATGGYASYTGPHWLEAGERVLRPGESGGDNIQVSVTVNVTASGNGGNISNNVEAGVLSALKTAKARKIIQDTSRGR